MINTSMSESDTMLIHMDKIPPNLCRIVARKGRKAMTNQEIADASGLTIKRVGEIAKLTSWGKVDVGQASAFAAACGVDLIKQGQVRKYLMRKEGCRLVHLENSPNKKYLTELCKIKRKT